MMLDDLIDNLAALLERERPDLVRGLRQTWSPHDGTLDGHWVCELGKEILALLSHFSDPQKVDAYNEIADAEGLSRLDRADQDVDFWIYQSFISPVIEKLPEEE